MPHEKKFVLNGAEALLSVLAVVSWLMGITLTTETSQTFFAIVMPPYAWYLVVESLMHHYWIF